MDEGRGGRQLFSTPSSEKKGNCERVDSSDKKSRGKNGSSERAGSIEIEEEEVGQRQSIETRVNDKTKDAGPAQLPQSSPNRLPPSMKPRASCASRGAIFAQLYGTQRRMPGGGPDREDRP
ncbi:hypothetical protein TRAPUB_13090 [Trametes pubescens]|uniref:Uncharacterized protein n=1 Tax=Trametes pubescens TaxID=154538 RepID=A0A1M2VS57_TRAPU|nr:hypothetical protein TRAPUB_13090 [Trametes pubescens]